MIFLKNSVTAFLFLSQVQEFVFGCTPSARFKTDFIDNSTTVTLERDDPSDREIAHGILSKNDVDLSVRFKEPGSTAATAFRDACSKCNTTGMCEHFEKPDTSHHRTVVFPPHAERFIRAYSVMVDLPMDDPTTNVTIATCFKWLQQDLQDYSEKLDHFNGTVQEGEACDPERKVKPEKEKMCQNFVPCPALQQHTIAAPTNLTCDSLTSTCKKADPRVTWHDQDPEELTKMFNNLTDCLTEYGEEKVQNVINSTFGEGGDGHRLHLEDCEAINAAPPEKRCKILSGKARFYNDSKPKKPFQSEVCKKVTHLNCDPILKKCLCGYTFNRPDLDYQFGNRSEVCFVRPTFAKDRSISCGGRSFNKSVSKLIPRFDKSICRCQSEENLIYFNSHCDQWWVCRGSRTASNIMLLFTIMIAIMLA